MSSADRWTDGRSSAASTPSSVSKIDFSASSLHGTPTARRGGVGGSGGSVKPQSGSGSGIRGRTTNHTTHASRPSPRRQSAPNHGWSTTASVKSSFATWIQYSWGSLTNTQSPPAKYNQKRPDQRSGSQRVRSPS